MPTRTLPKRDREVIGRRFATIRANRKMSQSALAKRARVDQSAITRLESGKRLPILGTLIQIAAELGAPLNWFLEGKGDLPELPPADQADRDQRFRDK